MVVYTVSEKSRNKSIKRKIDIYMEETAGKEESASAAQMLGADSDTEVSKKERNRGGVQRLVWVGGGMGSKRKHPIFSSV